MGNKNTKAKEDPVNKALKKFHEENDTTSVIIVGNPCSGKSTVFKSIQFTHDPDNQKYIQENKGHMIDIILNNCIYAMHTLLTLSTKLSGQSTNDNACNMQECKLVLDGKTLEYTQLVHYCAENRTHFDAQHKTTVAKAISFLWNLSPIQCTFAYAMKGKYYNGDIQDNMDYFFNKANTIFAENYTPSHQDMLCMRTRTTGFVQFECKYDNRNYCFVDVGGRRSERKKWMRFLENAGVIFVCELNGYCKTLPDYGGSGLALKESLNMFENVMSVKNMAHCPVVVFLNKTDMLKRCLRETSFKTCFDEYDGRVCGEFGTSSVFNAMIRMYEQDFNLQIPNNIQQLLGLHCAFLACDYWFDLCYRDAIEFVTNKFMKIAPENVIKGVYETCAIEMNQIAKVVDNMLDLDVFKTI
eukprot:272156_1